jgi:hypothetical protein
MDMKVPNINFGSLPPTDPLQPELPMPPIELPSVDQLKTAQTSSSTSQRVSPESVQKALDNPNETSTPLAEILQISYGLSSLEQ